MSQFEINCKAYMHNEPFRLTIGKVAFVVVFSLLPLATFLTF